MQQSPLEQALPNPWSNGEQPPIDWKVPGPNQTDPGQANVDYLITYEPVISSGQGLSPDNTFDPAYFAPAAGWGIKSVKLPNGTSWSFEYSGLDLTKVTTPSGGSISYTYQTVNIANSQVDLSLSLCNGVCHAAKTRVESDGTNSWTTSYSYKGLESFSGCSSFAMATTETDDLGNDTVHTFCTIDGNLTASSWQEIQTDSYQGSASNGGTLLKRVSTNQRDFLYNHDFYHAGITNVLPTSNSTTMYSAGTQGQHPSTTVTTVKQYSPLFRAADLGCSQYSTSGPVSCSMSTALSETFNFVEPVNTTTSSDQTGIIRNTSTMFEWMHSSNYFNQNFLTIPYQVTTYDSSSSPAAQTTYGYDESPSPAGVYGNQTSVTKWLNTGDPVVTSTQYESTYGMPVVKLDGNRNKTTITYDSTYHLYPQLVTHPATNGVAHTDQYAFDLATGRVRSHTDENGNTTTYSFDSVGRIIDAIYPMTLAGRPEVKTCYTDESTCVPTSPPNSVVTTTSATPSPDVITVHSYDGLGRKVADILWSDPAGASETDTQYDEYGRAISVTTPHRLTPASTDPPVGTTYTTYDALGRVVRVQQPDGNSVWSCYDALPTFGQTNCHSLYGNGGYSVSTWVDTADESGHDTQRVSDILGRLAAVTESSPASSALALRTIYGYDTLDNLVSVDQFGSDSGSAERFRRFGYDSLSRLITSYNPETGNAYSATNGTTCYGVWDAIGNCVNGYDANDNLLRKTDARGITVDYSPPDSPIDALNRVTKKSYSTGEPSVYYRYDNPDPTANGKGRLFQEFTGESTAPISSRIVLRYDVMGRVLSERRCVRIGHCSTGSEDPYAYASAFQYDSAGRLNGYGSGYGSLTFAGTYDGSGRVASLKGTASSSSINLFWAPSYTPAGALSGAMLGGQLNLSRTYDVRQRIASETDSQIVVNDSAGPVGSTVIDIQGAEQAK